MKTWQIFVSTQRVPCDKITDVCVKYEVSQTCKIQTMRVIWFRMKGQVYFDFVYLPVFE
jgi:hypothetical protein